MTKKKLLKFVRANVLSVQSVIQGNGRGIKMDNGRSLKCVIWLRGDNISTSHLSLTSSEHLGRFIREIAAGKKLIEDFSVCHLLFSLSIFFQRDR